MNGKGFTLIELLIVLAIAGILASIAITYIKESDYTEEPVVEEQGIVIGEDGEVRK